MNTKHVVSALLLSLSICCISFADRQLDRGEILQIFEKLTSQPRNTWISAGTIDAAHEEYRAPKVSDIAEVNRQIAEQIQEYQNNPNKRELTQELQKNEARCHSIQCTFQAVQQIHNEFQRGRKVRWEQVLLGNQGKLTLRLGKAGRKLSRQFHDR